MESRRTQNSRELCGEMGEGRWASICQHVGLQLFPHALGKAVLNPVNAGGIPSQRRVCTHFLIQSFCALDLGLKLHVWCIFSSHP